MFPAYWPRSFQRRGILATLGRQNLSHNSLFYQIPSVSSEELALFRLARCELSQFRCHGHSLLLSSYLCKIKRKEDFSCSACGVRTPLQDLTRLLDCPASEPLWRAIFGTASIFDFGSRTYVAQPLGLRGIPPRPHPSEGIW